MRRRRLPAVDAGAPGGRPGRHAGLHGRARQLGLDQHQGRAADALRPHRHHRLHSRRQAVLARLRRHRQGLRHPRRIRRCAGRRAAGGRARARVGRTVAGARHASTATWRWPDPTRPAGGTCRCPRVARSTTSSWPGGRRSSTDEHPRLADRHRADRVEQRRPVRPRAGDRGRDRARRDRSPRLRRHAVRSRLPGGRRAAGGAGQRGTCASPSCTPR